MNEQVDLPRGPVPAPGAVVETEGRKETPLLNPEKAGIQTLLLLGGEMPQTEISEQIIGEKIQKIAENGIQSSTKITNASFYERSDHWTTINATRQRNGEPSLSPEEQMSRWLDNTNTFLREQKQAGNEAFFSALGITDFDNGAKDIYDKFMRKGKGDMKVFVDLLVEKHAADEIDIAAHHELIQTFGKIYGKKSAEISVLLAEGVTNAKNVQKRQEYLTKANEQLTNTDSWPDKDKQLIYTLNWNNAAWQVAQQAKEQEAQQQPAQPPPSPPQEEEKEKREMTDEELKALAEEIQKNAPSMDELREVSKKVKDSRLYLYSWDEFEKVLTLLDSTSDEIEHYRDRFQERLEKNKGKPIYFEIELLKGWKNTIELDSVFLTFFGENEQLQQEKRNDEELRELVEKAQVAAPTLDEKHSYKQTIAHEEIILSKKKFMQILELLNMSADDLRGYREEYKDQPEDKQFGVVFGKDDKGMIDVFSVEDISRTIRYLNSIG